MKRFLIKLTALLLIMAALITGYDAAYRRICKIDPTQNDEYKFQHVPDGIQICNFGSSHGRDDFDYSAWQEEYTTFNFALVMQTASYDYRIMQQYIGNLAEGGVVFIPISYFTFGWDEESKEDFRSKNERYYSFLEPRYIKDYDVVTDIGIRHFLPLLDDPTNVIRKIRNALNKTETTELPDTELPDNAEETEETAEAPEATETAAETEDDETEEGGFDFMRHAEEKRLLYRIVDRNGDLLVRDEELDAVYGMIRLCKAHGLRPILITVPFRWEYNDQFEEEYRRQFSEVIDRICQDEDVEYYDYSHDERFTDNAKYFRNSDHLSPKGAKAFTEIIMNAHVKNQMPDMR